MKDGRLYKIRELKWVWDPEGEFMEAGAPGGQYLLVKAMNKASCFMDYRVSFVGKLGELQDLRAWGSAKKAMAAANLHHQRRARKFLKEHKL
jgi:hypothetical protein